MGRILRYFFTNTEKRDDNNNDVDYYGHNFNNYITDYSHQNRCHGLPDYKLYTYDSMVEDFGRFATEMEFYETSVLGKLLDEWKNYNTDSKYCVFKYD